jgi:two-component system, OmpR family, KDP operon response regulator KdpE
MTRILVVDDEPQMVRALRINLVARHYDVDTAPDGASALSAASQRRPDLVVLDLGLPDMEGTEVIRGLRGWTTIPIIVLSRRADSRDKVSASTPAPTKLLEHLLRHPGKLLSQRALLHDVWGPR